MTQNITVLAKLQKELAATSSTNQKKSILETYVTLYPEIKQLLVAIYSPFQNYYITSVEPPEYFDNVSIEIESVLYLLSKANSREYTPAQTKQAIDSMLHKHSEECYEAVKLIIDRDLHCAVGVTLINSVVKGLIPDFSYMRCSLPKKVKLEQKTS